MGSNKHEQDVYDQLEAKIQEMIASGTLDEKRQIAYQSFLFIIMYDPSGKTKRRGGESQGASNNFFVKSPGLSA